MSQESGASLLLASNLKLRGEENYQQWKFTMENVARVHGLRRFYHPKAPKPPKFVDEFDEGVSEEEFQKYDEWAKGDSKMKLCISSNVSTSILCQINSFATAKEMWDSLANQYESSGIVLNQQAIAKYIKMRYSDYSTIDEFIIAFQNAIDTLNRLNIAPPDSWHPLVFLEALKDSFPIWAERQRAACRDKSSITLNELIHDIKDEARADTKSSGIQMTLYGSHKNNNENKAGSSQNGKSKLRPRPIDCKVCGNPKARHAKGKCLEDPKNKDLLKQWEERHKKKWRKFKDQKANNASEKGKSRDIESDNDVPRFGGLPCINMTVYVTKNSDRWLPDTGATSHIANTLDKFDHYKEVANLPLIATANGSIRPRGIGTVTLQCKLSNGENNPFELKDVMYLPECPINLFSGDKLLKAGGYMKNGKMFGPDDIEFATYDNSLQINESFVTVALPALVGQSTPTLDLWHRRLGHLGLRNVRETAKITTGISFETAKTPTTKPTLCESCELSKPLRHVRKSVSSRPHDPLDSVSVDVVLVNPPGKILANDSWISVHYCTIFTDAATSVRWGYFHKEKNGATEAIKYFNSLMKTQFNAVAKSFRIDGGKEYSPKMIGILAAELGQIMETTTPYFPEQDGRAERSIGIIMSRVRTVSIEMNIPKFLWPELIRSQLQIANRTATSVLQGETPIQSFNRYMIGIDEKPDLSHLRVLGCKAYVQIPVQKRVLSRKLDKRAEIGILVGYEGQHIYRVYIPGRQKVIRSSAVRFDENSLVTSTMFNGELWDTVDYATSSQVDESSGENMHTVNQHESSIDLLTPFEHLSFDKHQQDERLGETESEINQTEEDENVRDSVESSRSDNLQIEGNSPEGNLPVREILPGNISSTVNHEDLPESSTVSRRGRPPGRKNKQYQKVNRVTRSTAAGSVSDQQVAFLSFVVGSQSLFTVEVKSDPKTLAEAMSCKDSRNWRLAIDHEYRSLAKKKTWSLVRRLDLPRGTKVLTGKLVLRTKRGKEGEILKFKARWVVRGFEQEYGRDYTQTYAGVCRNTTWKIVLALATRFDLEVEQMDAVTAFLNSDADDDIYVEIPPGWVEPGMKSTNQFVCKLEKALYGLKQAPRLWQRHLRRCLAEVDFEPLASDNCLYLNKQSGILIVTYVDDFLIIGKIIAEINQLKRKLAEKFQLEDLGPASYFLGVRITRDRLRKRTYLAQDAYADQILERFGLENCRPTDTPMAAGFEKFLVPNDGNATAAEIRHYQSKVGSLLYLAVHTRPDIAFACSAFSRYLSNPSPQHLKGVDRIFRYLKGTMNLGVMYDGNSSKPYLHGYCDSDWGGDKGTRRSTGGSVFFFSGGVISASSKSQPNVSLSSTEAEYYAYSSCIQELLWIQQVMHQMQYSGKDIVTTRIYSDNQSSMALGNNPELHQRTKHIDIKHHFIRQHIEAGQVDARYISTHDMAADGLTKSLSHTKHSKFVEMLNLKVANID